MESEDDYMVKVVDIHRDNLKVIWPCLMHSIQKSSFVAIDCELSGLGDRKLINSQAVDERYSNIGSAAKTRSIISIGLCCFHSEPLQRPSSRSPSQEQTLIVPFEVQTFNIVALCSEEYVVEPSALQFLVNHDFDFQKQYAKGIPYCRGSQVGKDTEDVTLGKSSWNLRDIFDALVLAQVPIILHNGLVDLIFMYQNLYADLPTSLPSFLADLDMMFPGGIFDTKYVAEFDLRLKASFLEYVFRSCQLHNLEAKHKNEAHVRCIHSLPNSEYTDAWNCSPQLQEIPDQAEICPDYSNFGHCKSGSLCLRSHDVFRVILEEKEKSRKKRRKNGMENEEYRGIPSYFDKTCCQERFKGHRAGHDAFMTAFSFASFLVRKLAACRGTTEGVLLTSLTKDLRNRICLSGKDFPLLIQKSHFSKYSKAHLVRYAQLVPGTTETSKPDASS